jgi:hypothetical protein
MSSADRSPAFYSVASGSFLPTPALEPALYTGCDDPEQRTPQPYEQRNRGGVTNDDNRS